MKKDNNLLHVKAFRFSVRIIRMYQYLVRQKKEFILSKQSLRSGTAIGALIYEAEFAQSKADFISKLSIALKEANETRYWLMLFMETNYLDEKQFVSMKMDCEELIKLLVSSINTLKASRKSF